MKSNNTIAVVGAGISGLAVAIALQKIGTHVEVFEQAGAFKRVGAAINMTPNAVKVLDGLGLGKSIRSTAHIPPYRISRMWDTGLETSRVELGDTAQKRYGAPTLLMHRADLLTALEGSVPPNFMHMNKKLIRLKNEGNSVILSFEDGSSFVADGVIGADGIHSIVREQLFGPEAPIFAGMSAYRSIISVQLLDGKNLNNFVKWWGPTPQSQIVMFLINRGKEFFVFATMPEVSGGKESWSKEGDIGALRSHFGKFHGDAKAVLYACDETLQTALYERNPLSRWSEGAVTLIGDACHAMMPFMAQGAAMGLEDAVVLSRCVDTSEEWSTAIRRYEGTRIERTSKIQLGSNQNEWLRETGNPDWV
ncbi:MAG TPA: salicylate hydroxylase, partial [Rhodospirillales bacterium]|nr:salicylate hydroxylase [Rhodospirillales bacterium]